MKFDAFINWLQQVTWHHFPPPNHQTISFMKIYKLLLSFIYLTQAIIYLSMTNKDLPLTVNNEAVTIDGEEKLVLRSELVFLVGYICIWFPYLVNDGSTNGKHFQSVVVPVR